MAVEEADETDLAHQPPWRKQNSLPGGNAMSNCYGSHSTFNRGLGVESIAS